MAVFEHVVDHGFLSQKHSEKLDKNYYTISVRGWTSETAHLAYM